MKVTEQKKRIDIIGYDSGWGCGDYRCEDGPYKIALDQLVHKTGMAGFDPQWLGTLGLKFLGRHDLDNTKEKTLTHVLTGLRRLQAKVKASAEAGHIPFVVGGDHTSAIGTWAGIAGALRAPGHFGLIWIDAHLDSHTYETSHEGKFGGWWHGQAVSALLGYGLRELVSIGGHIAKIAPENITIIGAHSFEPAEQSFVRKHNIRVITLDEVKKIGFSAAFDEGLKRAMKGTKGFGMTVDLDAFDPSESPGVGAAEDKGLYSSDVLPVIRGIGRHPSFAGLEITEYNPHKDIAGKTALLLEKLAESIFRL